MNTFCNRAILVIATMLFLLAGRPAMAWWNGGWSYRMKVHLDTSAKGIGIADLPGRTQVLVRLHSGNFNFDNANPDGADLRIVAGDDRTPLHFQIEKFDGLADQVALIWVDVPQLVANADTTLFVYWGNKGAQPASDGKGTYAAEQALVYHFAEPTGLPKDSTGTANDAVRAADHGLSGLAGSDAKFNGRGLVLTPPSDSLRVAAGGPVTWSMWVRPAADPATQTAVLLSQGDATNGIILGLDQGIPYFEVSRPDGAKRASGKTALDPSSWHLLVATASDKVAFYVDGEPAGEVAGGLPAIAAGVALGGVPAAPIATAAPGGGPDPSASADPTRPYTGEIDEFRVLRAAVQGGTVKLWMTEKNPERFIAFDVAEQTSTFGNGYVGIIARSVTPDAWFVIGLLMIMSLISWWAMVSKVLFLNRVSRANTAFEGRYAVVSAPGASAGAAASEITPESSQRLRSSPLFRLYRVGMRELDQRLAAGMLEGDGRLAPQSIAAMQAALDAALVRESQRLSSTMVLLTICISGGPFLGLLGTVVGVMITFAAIAQAGDVNVNAIAPGVAAALLATVAGLFVAIPALFGYNYLVTRIKETSQRMNAFVNEMVTRTAEQVRKPGDRTAA